jgi:hypothetical protein
MGCVFLRSVLGGREGPSQSPIGSIVDPCEEGLRSRYRALASADAGSRGGNGGAPALNSRVVVSGGGWGLACWLAGEGFLEGVAALFGGSRRRERGLLEGAADVEQIVREEFA